MTNASSYQQQSLSSSPPSLSAGNLTVFTSPDLSYPPTPPALAVDFVPRPYDPFAPDSEEEEDIIQDDLDDDDAIEDDAILLSDYDEAPFRLAIRSPTTPLGPHPRAPGRTSGHPTAGVESQLEETLHTEEDDDDDGGLVLAQLMKRAEGLHDRPSSPKRARESQDYSQTSSYGSQTQSHPLTSDAQVESSTSMNALSSPEERK